MTFTFSSLSLTKNVFKISSSSTYRITLTERLLISIKMPNIHLFYDLLIVSGPYIRSVTLSPDFLMGKIRIYHTFTSIEIFGIIPAGPGKSLGSRVRRFFDAGFLDSLVSIEFDGFVSSL